jgi:hypothetical protein
MMMRLVRGEHTFCVVLQHHRPAGNFRRSAAPSLKLRFPRRDLIGWTSKNQCQLDSVISTLMAAVATFALKAGRLVSHQRKYNRRNV